MNLFELFVKIGVDDSEFNKGIGKAKKGFGDFSAWTVAKGQLIADGIKAGGKALIDFGKQAINSYAEYEQLIGGVETLYGAKYKTIEEYIEGTGAAAETAAQTFAEYQNRQQDVLDNAASAYRTAGMSANEYMNTVNGFAASLTNSLGEYEWQAASYADMIVSDMADNANKMGTSMEMIQNAYAGFAKQNYTMLDNLKLGYGGTKTEMERLLRDAERMAGYIEGSLDIESFADIADAIHIVQEEMGITGTTALEAGRTISGSVGSMKAAWQNLLTGLADGNADIETLVENLVTTIVGDGTEANLGVLGNVMPAVKTALNGASKLVSELLPAIVQEIPSIINDNLPILAEAAISIIQSLVDGISQNQEMLMETAFETITFLATSLISMLPQIVALGLDLIVSLANGIAESLPTLIPTIIDVVLKIVETLTNPETLGNLLTAAIGIITALVDSILKPETLSRLLDAVVGIVDGIVKFVMDNLGPLLQAAIGIIIALVEYILDPDNIGKILSAAVKIVVSLAKGLLSAVGTLLSAAGQLITKLIQSIGSSISKFLNIGKNIVDGIKQGISNAWNNLVSWFKGLFGNLIGIAKKILGIASPSKVFKKLGGFTAEGFGIGFEDEFAHVKDDMEDALNFDDASVGINASIRKVGAGAAGGALGGTSIGNITINIDGAKYSDEQSLASAIALEIQNMTDRRIAAYGY